MIKYHEAKIGTVVCYSKDFKSLESMNSIFGKIYPNLIGHIIGFKINANNQVLIEVKFCTGAVKEIHPNNLDMYIGE